MQIAASDQVTRGERESIRLKRNVDIAVFDVCGPRFGQYPGEDLSTGSAVGLDSKVPVMTFENARGRSRPEREVRTGGNGDQQ
jgi:hypothetical protein